MNKQRRMVMATIGLLSSFALTSVSANPGLGGGRAVRVEHRAQERASRQAEREPMKEMREQMKESREPAKDVRESAKDGRDGDKDNRQSDAKGDGQRKAGRLTPEERRNLRRQINEAGQDLYQTSPRN